MGSEDFGAATFDDMMSFEDGGINDLTSVVRGTWGYALDISLLHELSSRDRSGQGNFKVNYLVHKTLLNGEW